MAITNVKEAALDPLVQGTSTTGIVVAANADKIAHWYDPFWLPIWNFLPWSQLATIIGIGWIGYMAYVSITDRKKSK